MQGSVPWGDADTLLTMAFAQGYGQSQAHSLEHSKQAATGTTYQSPILDHLLALSLYSWNWLSFCMEGLERGRQDNVMGHRPIVFMSAAMSCA